MEPPSSIVLTKGFFFWNAPAGGGDAHSVTRVVRWERAVWSEVRSRFEVDRWLRLLAPVRFL